jgi:hemolysin activation/secretion protein
MTKKLLTLSLLTSSALMAVTPTTGDILRQVEQPKLPVAPKALPSVGAGEYKAPLSAKDDVVTFVKSFKFSGNTAFSSEILSSLVKPYEGKDLGINGLKEVASIITKYYRDNGYFVARAYIPAQSMEEGIIEIAIIEGQYGCIRTKKQLSRRYIRSTRVHGPPQRGRVSLHNEPRAPNAPRQRPLRRTGH